MCVCAAVTDVAQLPSILVSAPAEPLSVQSGDIDAQDGTAGAAAVHSADDQAAAAARASDATAPQQEEVIDVTHTASLLHRRHSHLIVVLLTELQHLCFV